MWLVVKYNAARHQPDVSVMNDKILPVEGLSHESVGRKKVNCSPILPVPNLSHSQETLSLFVGKMALLLLPVLINLAKFPFQILFNLQWC